jgi:hypothetical protein
MLGIRNPVEPDLIQRILGEYREMPGLALTCEQACRLSGCDVRTGRRAIDELVARQLLRWTPEGLLVRA